MSATMNKIRKLKAELEKQIADGGKAALKEEFAEFFDAHKNVAAVRWEQYTPYFNDGEACVFGVGEFSAKLKDIDLDDEDEEEDGFIDRYAMTRAEKSVPDGDEEAKDWSGRTFSRPKYKTIACDPIAPDVAKALSKFERELDSDVLEAVFGDHVRVTATRRGFKVEEYSHD